MTLWLRASGISGNPIDSWANDPLGAGGGSFINTLTARPSQATINGIIAADFDGTNDSLLGATAASNYMTTSAFEGACVVRMDTLGVDVDISTVYGADSIWTLQTGAFAGLQITTSGARLYTFNGSVYVGSGYAAITTGQTQLIRFRLSGGTLYVRVGAGAEVSAAGALSSLASVMRLGANYNATSFCDGALCEMIMSNAVLSASDRAGLGEYLGAKWGCAA